LETSFDKVKIVIKDYEMFKKYFKYSYGKVKIGGARADIVFDDPNAELHIYVLDIIGEVSNAHAIDDYEEEEYIPSSTNGDYSPNNPWDAPGMSIKDFI
jgi:hypothetical protein